MKGEAKQAIRERVWSRLEAAGAVTPGVAGYIPDFVGADLAAQRLASLRPPPSWLPRTRFTSSTPPRSPSHRPKPQHEK